MQVLNKNQRENAIWRLLCLGFIILALNGAFLIGMHNDYSQRGNGELVAIRSAKEQALTTAQGREQDLQAKIKVLQEENSKLKGEKAKLDSDNERMVKIEIPDLKDQRDKYYQALMLCNVAKSAKDN